MTEGRSAFCAYRATIHGMVQGVGFRYAAFKQARVYALRGWIKNNRDGTVEIYCEGTYKNVKRFLNWLHDGPPLSKVSKVDSREVPMLGVYDKFSIDQ